MRTSIENRWRSLNGVMQHGFRTKKAAVEAGLRLLADIHGQTAIREFRGKVTWEGDLNESRLGRYLDWGKHEA